MAALTGLDDIVNRTTGGSSGNPQSIWFFKDSRVGAAAAAAPVAGRMTSLWTYDGQPSDGAVPAGAANPDVTTAGALKQTNAAGGAQKYLLGVSGVVGQAGTLILYDRLLHAGGFSGTTITAQTVGGTLSRNTGGLGNQLWVEISIRRSVRRLRPSRLRTQTRHRPLAARARRRPSVVPVSRKHRGSSRCRFSRATPESQRARRSRCSPQRSPLVRLD